MNVRTEFEGLIQEALCSQNRPGVPGTSDTQGVNTDTAVSLVLEAAEKVGGIKVAFHLERKPNCSSPSESGSDINTNFIVILFSILW